MTYEQRLNLMSHASLLMPHASLLMPHTSSLMPLRAIAFDLWETLLTDTPELSRAQEQLRLERMERSLVARGFSAEAHRIEEAYRKLWRRCHELYWSADIDVPCRRQIELF